MEIFCEFHQVFYDKPLYENYRIRLPIVTRSKELLYHVTVTHISSLFKIDGSSELSGKYCNYILWTNIIFEIPFHA